jgi:hypothetical protein
MLNFDLPTHEYQAKNDISMSNLADLSNHLAAHNEREAAKKLEAKLAEAHRLAAIERFVSISRDALNEHVEPSLQAVSRLMKESGKDSEVRRSEDRDYAESARFNKDKEVGAATISLNVTRQTCSLTQTCSLNFHAYIAEDAWRIVSSVVPESLANGSLRAIAVIASADVDQLAAWSEQRAVAFTKAVFP